ncbi:hypothetical protein [Hydrocarboniclastica marina]|uniref:Uncharacterized protein n=1 Tax=Hydrocarboniclastica marina TaxID=2259620 RepID=A0A4P7XI27_9ALTE|nr:hypothetical protein [Hydrocarboniclastica marina]QCF26729.1 hypothetical protein soil367_12745 [Hydrocarboniclastica marina]
MAKDPEKLVQRQLLLMAAAIGLFVCGVVVSGATVFSVGTAKLPKDADDTARATQTQARFLSLIDVRPVNQLFYPVSPSFQMHQAKPLQGGPSRFVDRLAPHADLSVTASSLDWRSPFNEPKHRAQTFADVNWSTISAEYGAPFKRVQNTGFVLSPLVAPEGRPPGYSFAERAQGEVLVSDRFTFGQR